MSKVVAIMSNLCPDKVRGLSRVVSCCTVVAVLLVSAGCTHGGRVASARIADEAQIEQVERDRQDAFVRGDVSAIDRDTASDYSTINGSGKRSTKPEMMQSLRQGKTKVLSVRLDGLKARIYGETAVLTGEYHDVNLRDGIQRETHACFTRVFVKTDGRWKAVAYQQTPILEVRQ